MAAATRARECDPPSERRFARVLTLNPRAGILLLVVFGVVRVALVLQANVTGSYQVVSLVFVAMIALPWVLLTRDGRKLIGLVRPARWRWVLPAVIAGVALALTVYAGVLQPVGHHRGTSPPQRSNPRP